MRPADRALVRDLLEAKPQAWDRFVGRVADSVWTACRLLTTGDAEARDAFNEVMEEIAASGFRRLKPYDGSSRIDTFVALLAREILAERLMRRLQPDSRGDIWGAFERFFRPDIQRIIARRLPGLHHEETRRDAYQDVCLGLIADDYRRLKSYRGVGSFTGYVLHTVDRLLIDSLRRTSPRRRGEQPIVRPTETTLDEDIPADHPSPEDSLVQGEDEQMLSAAAGVLREAAASLSEAERLYLRIALGSGEPIPAREVARLMRRPVEEVYKLKQRVMARLRETLSKHPAVKLWRASV